MALDIPLWPASLPMPDRDGYQYGLEAGLIRTQFSGGYVRQRRSVWGMPAMFTLAFRMNTAQLGVLQTFLDGFGFGWFAMDLVSGGARVALPKSDCALHKVRVTTNPVHEMIAPNTWRVTLQAEVQSLRDVRADTDVGVAFATVDAVTPTTIDELTDFDTLTA